MGALSQTTWTPKPGGGILEATCPCGTLLVSRDVRRRDLSRVTLLIEEFATMANSPCPSGCGGTLYFTAEERAAAAELVVSLLDRSPTKNKRRGGASDALAPGRIILGGAFEMNRRKH